MAPADRELRPGPHPPPPADLGLRELPWVELAGPWFRVHDVSHDPLFFGKTRSNRFDAPDASFGVLYVGLTEACAFIETFGEPLDQPFITQADADSRKLSLIHSARPLRAVELDGAGLKKVGADSRLLSADHGVAQTWSKALREHPSGPDGILFRARHDNAQFALALFDHCAVELSAQVAAEPLGAASSADLLGRLLNHYHLGLLR